EFFPLRPHRLRVQVHALAAFPSARHAAQRAQISQCIGIDVFRLAENIVWNVHVPGTPAGKEIRFRALNIYFFEYPPLREPGPAFELVGERGFEPPAPTSRRFRTFRKYLISLESSIPKQVQIATAKSDFRK